MSARTLNRLLRRRRRHVAAVAVVLGLVGVVTVHHIPMPDEGMGAMGMGAMVVCLGVLPAIAAALSVVGGLLPPPGLVAVLPWASNRILASPPHPRARSSPVGTVVLRL